MARLIDADAFDRKLAAAEFDAALNNADDESRPFREQTMYYSTQSFRDVMSYLPTVDAIPVEWLREKMLRPQMTDGNPFGFVLAEWLEEQEAR